MATDDKKSSFLDRLSGKVSEGFKTNPGDVIHEGISDDELDKLLSGDIKSSTRPPTNPSGPAEFSMTEPVSSTPSDTTNNTTVGGSVFVDAVREGSTNDTDDTTVSLTTEKVVDALNSSVINPVEELEIEAASTSTETTIVDEPIDLIIDSSATEAPSLSEQIDTNTVPGIEIAGVDATTTSFEAVNVTEVEEETPTIDLTIDLEEDATEVDTTNDDIILTVDETSNQNEQDESATVDAAVEPLELSTEIVETPTTNTEDNSTTYIDSDTDTVENATSESTVEATEEEKDQVETDIEPKNEDAPKTASPEANETAEETPSVETATVETTVTKTVASAALGAISTGATTTLLRSDESKTPEKTQTKVTTLGNKTMSNQLEKIQTDIDELKRKIHAMSSEYFTAATDSATLIGEIREFDSNSSDDFTGTYNQVRELRKILIDARKLFTQLPVTLDMLEEALENDLYTAKK